MSDLNMDKRERLLDLLAEKALQGLSQGDSRELESLLLEFPDIDALEFERAAATVAMLGLDHDPMPDQVRDKVERDAIGWMADQRGLSVTSAPQPAPQRTAPPATEPDRNLIWMPWVAAAAAAFMAIIAWWPSGDGIVPPAELFSDLAERSDAVRVAWLDPLDQGVTGEIIWDNDAQEGVMKFSGLARNSPGSMQYQLWIFDRQRQVRSDFDAVDGGVFNVPKGEGPVFIPVTAKLKVFDPYQFAVTTEPPGGVVKHVTDDDHKIVLVAPVS